MKRYVIIAGEISGDNYGSKLIASIRSAHNDRVEFWGIGGPKMVEAGLNSLANIDNIAVVGFSEVIKKLPVLLRLLNRLALFINELNPDNIILIDFPGFNLKLAQKIKKQSKKLKITYFISPQIWAWNEGRIKNIKKYIDLMLVIFPFEKEYYLSKNINVHYIGHPFLDDLELNSQINNKTNFGFSENKKIIGIFPGSRREEIKRHLPIYLKSIRIFKKNHPNIECAIGLAPGFDIEKIQKEYHTGNIPIINKNPLLMLSCCDVALVTSGTISLEATFMNIPSIVSYKLSTLSWLISKILIKTKYISITNIMANRMLIPEFIQHNVTSKNIIKELSNSIYEKNILIKNELKKIQNEFSDRKNAIDNAVKLITLKNESD